MTRDLQALLSSGVGSDRWFHRRNQDYETKMGFYRAQVVDKRWWIIDPQNRPWLSMGICHITYEAPRECLLPLFEATLRPMMITEWSFKAMDSGLPNTKGAAIPVHTQADRADGYERYVEGALELPFVVGLHWFQYTDQPILGRSLDGENSNYGVVDVQDEPYFTLVERMRVVNEGALEIARHSRRLSELDAVDDDWMPY